MNNNLQETQSILHRYMEDVSSYRNEVYYVMAAQKLDKEEEEYHRSLHNLLNEDLTFLDMLHTAIGEGKLESYSCFIRGRQLDPIDKTPTAKYVSMSTRLRLQPETDLIWLINAVLRRPGADKWRDVCEAVPKLEDRPPMLSCEVADGGEDDLVLTLHTDGRTNGIGLYKINSLNELLLYVCLMCGGYPFSHKYYGVTLVSDFGASYTHNIDELRLQYEKIIDAYNDAYDAVLVPRLNDLVNRQRIHLQHIMTEGTNAMIDLSAALGRIETLEAEAKSSADRYKALLDAAQKHATTNLIIVGFSILIIIFIIHVFAR